ncbi:TPA: tail fiber domain-containing protein [Escherichia coli]
MIYTTGTIAISGNTVAGTGTDFTAPLSLIRVGCTLIAIRNPVQIFTITEIKSGTKLSVTPAAGPAIPAGTKFSILLSDSISVDGLAQDVAETLRYYQGKETEIAEAIKFFREFDFNALTTLANKVHTDSAQVSADKATVQQYKTDSESAQSAAKAAKNQAVLAQKAAETANTNAQAASTAAQRFRDQAEEWAQSINADNLLTKSGNLAGITDLAKSRNNLGLGSAATLDAGTSGNKVPKLNNANTWSRPQTFLTPLEVKSGGTGVNRREDLWPVVRPLDVLGNVGRYTGIPDGITRNHIWLWNTADTPPSGWANYIDGGWFNGYWRLGGIRGGGEDLAACQLSVVSGQGTSYDYVFNNNGTASAANWANTSDIRVKSDIAKIADPLTKMRSIRGVSWTYRFKNNPLKGFGFIAQEVQKYFPDAVSVVSKNPVTLEDDTVVEDVMSVDTVGVSAALHHEAILALMDRMEDMQKELEELKAAVAAQTKA